MSTRETLREIIELGAVFVLLGGLLGFLHDDGIVRGAAMGTLLFVLILSVGAVFGMLGNPSLPTSKDDARVDAAEAESVGNCMLYGHAPCLACHNVDALGRRVRIVEIESGRRHLVP